MLSGARGSRSHIPNRMDRWLRRDTGYPVIPVQPGIFSIVPKKYRFGTGKSEANQVFADQFPWPAKREFIRG
jgi:hypothetical protein